MVKVMSNMWLDVLRDKHFRVLYEISKRVEPLSREMSFEKFQELMG